MVASITLYCSRCLVETRVTGRTQVARRLASVHLVVAVCAFLRRSGWIRTTVSRFAIQTCCSIGVLPSLSIFKSQTSTCVHVHVHFREHGSIFYQAHDYSSASSADLSSRTRFATRSTSRARRSGRTLHWSDCRVGALGAGRADGAGGAAGPSSVIPRGTLKREAVRCH